MCENERTDRCLYCGEMAGYPLCTRCADAYEADVINRYGDFRAWDSELGVMKYGVDPTVETNKILPFMGIKDCNGQKIFEGDVVRDVDSGVEFIVSPTETPLVAPKIAFVCLNLEVVGNVFENNNKGD